MSNTSSIFGAAIIAVIRETVRDEIKAASVNGHQQTELLSPEQLAERLKVPLSWVYEQSRQKRIPTHRLGRYIRFDLHEVLESQKEDSSVS